MATCDATTGTSIVAHAARRLSHISNIVASHRTTAKKKNSVRPSRSGVIPFDLLHGFGWAWGLRV